MTTALALLAALAAQNPNADAPNAPPAPEALARAVRQLGDDDYHVRERASRWLWAVGAAAEPAVREGLKSTDAEVIARCRDLLDKIPYGITPDLPPRFVELIAVARTGGPNAWSGVIPDLLDLGPRGLDVVHKLIERLATSPSQRVVMNRVLDREGWRVVPALLAERRFDQAEDLLERGAVAGSVAGAAAGGDTTAARHYATFLALRGRLDAQVPRWRALAERGGGQASRTGRLPDGSPDGWTAQFVLFHLARLHGDLALARAAADKVGRADLRETALFDQGAWAELIDFGATSQPMMVMALGLRALYQQLAGRDAEDTLAEIKKLDEAPSYTSTWMAFRALMAARRPADALAVVAKSPSLDFVLPRFEILCQQHRYDEAFKLLDRSLGERTVLRWQLDAARVRVHHQRGEADQVRDILRPLTALDRIIPAEARAAEELVEQLVTLGRADDALALGAVLLESGYTSSGTVRFNSGVNPAEVFGKLFPQTPLAAEAWWRYLRSQRPTEPVRATLARLPALLDTRLAGSEGQALVEAAAKVVRTQSPADAGRWLQGLGEACQSAGLTDAARRLYEEAATRTDGAAAWLTLGDFHADAGRWADATVAYDRAWRKDVKQPLPLWLCGFAKQRAGAADGPEMRELAHTIALGDEDIRSTFADELAKRSYLGSELMEAARRERRLVLRLANLVRLNPTPERPDRGREAQGALSSDPLAFADRLEAADCTQRFLVRLLRTNAIFKKNEGYLIVLNRLHTDRARGLLARGDVDEALREAAAAQEALPGYPSPAVSLVPELTRLGRTAEADRVYGTTAAVLDRLCREYPNGAGFHNDRACLAARCRRDLDDALTHARKAVELEPKSAGCRETLAEVHFQRGEHAAAVERIRQALELEPKNAYYVGQKRRIEAGDREAPLPEGR